MESGKVSTHTHITTDTIRAIDKYAHLTDQEATELLNQIKQISNMIHHFIKK